MTAKKSDIKRWLDEGVYRKATHMVVVCDRFEGDDYPVYVLPGQLVRQVVDDYARSEMQKVMEVYDLSMDIEEQLEEFRAWHC